MWIIVGAYLACIVASLVVATGAVLVERWRRWWFWSGLAVISTTFSLSVASLVRPASDPNAGGLRAFAWVTAACLATIAVLAVVLRRAWVKRYPTAQSRQECFDRFWREQLRDTFRMRPDELGSPRGGGQGEAELRARIRELEGQLAKMESARATARGAADGAEAPPDG